MANINDVIESLSEEELDLLNSDPEMLAAFKRKYQPDEGSHVTAGDVGRAAWDTVKDVGTMTKAGYAGVADLIAGNGVDKSVENIGHVKKGEDVTSGAAVFGEALGSQFTPGQIALQAAMGKVGEMVGPWVAKTLKGWAADAAVNAVGKIKSIAKALGVENLDAVGQFLLQPITIGGKTFEPIVAATSSPEEMRDAARKIVQAAGKQLESVSAMVDTASKANSDELVSSAAGTVAPILDTEALMKSVAALKEEAVGDLPNLGKPVAKQFNDALADLEEYVRTQATTANVNAFSKLASIRTKIGNLVYKHGSPLESKAALQDVYHAISDVLSQSATNVGGKVSEDYAQANLVYHQASAILEALEGKVVDAKKMFDGPAFLTALSSGMSALGTGHGILAGPIAIAGYGASKVAQKYGPQAIAAGLNASHPLVGKGIEVTARGIPVVARGIVDALTMKKADEQ